MLFNSVEFLLIFLPLALAGFYFVGKQWRGKGTQIYLIIASCGFYAWWEWKYLLLLLASTGINFWLGGKVGQSKSRVLLTAGIAMNLCLLGYFKYTDFAIENVNALLGSSFALLHVILPLGISFFSFQKIAYLVDCYKGEVDDRDPVKFGLFVMFFPQLIAGPIVHHSQIIPQLKAHEKSPLPSGEMVSKGIFYLVLGLFKKVIIADNIAGIVNPGFANVENLGLVEAWTVAVGYSLQLYFDFSAYSEMAIGIALLFGVVLPINFNSPYKASSIGDFWRRWHITLGAFMRQYLYIPMGGSRNGLGTLLFASFATMLIGGLWHGAAWTFVLWGALHGGMLVINRIWGTLGKPMGERLAKVLTLVCVIFAWVPFRATSVQDAMTIWQKMFGIGGVSLPMEYKSFPMMKELGASFHLSSTFNGFEIFGFLALLYVATHWKNVHENWAEFQPKLKSAGLVVGAGLMSIFGLSKASYFVYFNF